MRRLIRPIATLAVAACTAVVAVSGAGAAPAKVHYYLSLGDSIAQGYQPIGGADDRWSSGISFTHGYADQLFKLVRDRYTQLRLVKLGCYLETTQTMIDGDGSLCQYPAGSQLAQAEQFLTAHQGEVAFVTIDIGINDFDPADPIGSLNSIGTNLALILERLREAAGPDVPIIGSNFPAFVVTSVWDYTHDLTALADWVGFVSLVDYGFLGPIYAAAGDPVADLAAAFHSSDMTLVDGTPRDVLIECRLTWQCTGPPLGPDTHPNTEGYGVIARAFEEQLP